MKKITIVIIAVIIIIGGYIVLKGNSPKEAASTSETPATSANSTIDGKKMAFSQFMKQGGSYKCTVNQYLGAIGGPSMQGTTYISNGMVRANYNTTIQGKPTETSLLVRDGYSYMWTSIMPTTGFKMKAVVTQKPNATAPASGSYSFNADQIGDYNCESWTVDASLFAVPTTITFREM